ncbi:hypothetical protein BHM03_00059959 [Ensete ventricosum]|nr:hypothetical protein BHM03_00059959 [Ensete ventricosum]
MGVQRPERGERLLIRIEKQRKKRVLCFVDKTEIRLLGLEKKRKQPAMKRDWSEEQQRQRGDGLQRLEEEQRSSSTAGDRWCQCAEALLRLETGEAAGISLLWRKKGCQGCGNSINARWEIGADLVGSVGSGGKCRDSRWTRLESTIKYARDRKRWKLAVV